MRKLFLTIFLSFFPVLSVCGQDVASMLQPTSVNTVDVMSDGVSSTSQIISRIDWDYISTEDGITLTSYKGDAKEIIIPADLNGSAITGLGEALFMGDLELTSVVMPDSIIEFGSQLFANCINLESIIFSNSIEEINDDFCLNCYSLKTIKFPGNLNKIGDSAFRNATTLDHIVIPETVEEIGYSAFENCISLADLSIPDTIETIGSDCFQKTPWLEAQTADFVIAGNGNLLKYNGTHKTVRIPDQITRIEGAFANNYTLEEVILSGNVESIGTRSFTNNFSLKKVVIPEGVKEIGEGAFFECTSLTEISLPSSLETIEYKAFEGCSNLRTLVIPHRVTNIPSELCDACINLHRVVIPASVTHIADNAFVNANPNLVIEGSSDSVAQAFAVAHGISFAVMQNTAITE